MIKNALRTLAIAAPLALAVAAPAHAGSTLYSPDVAALVITQCDLNDFIMQIDGAAPSTAVTGWIQFDSKSKINLSGEFATSGGGTGGAGTWSYTKAYPSKTKKVAYEIHFKAITNGSGNVNAPHDVTRSDTLYRSDCPGLPVTGSNAAPIGKIALGAVLAGGLLATVAVRRRPRKANIAA